MADHEDTQAIIEAAAEQHDVDLAEAITAIDPTNGSSRIYILDQQPSGDYRLISYGLDANGNPEPTETPMQIPEQAISAVQELVHAAGMQRATNMLDPDGDPRSLRAVSESMGISEPHPGDL